MDLLSSEKKYLKYLGWAKNQSQINISKNCHTSKISWWPGHNCLQKDDGAALPWFHCTCPRAGGGRRFLLRRRQEWFVCCQHMLLKIQSWLGNEGRYLAIKLPSLYRVHYKYMATRMNHMMNHSINVSFRELFLPLKNPADLKWVEIVHPFLISLLLQVEPKFYFLCSGKMSSLRATAYLTVLTCLLL